MSELSEGQYRRCEEVLKLMDATNTTIQSVCDEGMVAPIDLELAHYRLNKASQQ